MHESLVDLLGAQLTSLDHVLRRCQSLADVVGTLHSRLRYMRAFAGTMEAFEPVLPKPYITAWRELPDQPSPARIRMFVGHEKHLHCCAFSPDGTLIVSGGEDRLLCLWDANTGILLNKVTVGIRYSVSHCTFSPDGQFIAATTNEGHLVMLDVRTFDKRFDEHIHKMLVEDVVFSPNGQFILTASQDQTVELRDTQTFSLQKTLTGHTKPVSCCAFSPDGQHIISASEDKTLRIWDAQTGDAVREIKLESGPYDLGISPDGKRAILNFWRSTKIIDLTDGTEPVTLENPTGGRRCAYSPDGELVVATAHGGPIVWDAQTGKRRLTLTPISGGVTDLAFSPDSNHLITSSNDKTLTLWDVKQIDSASENIYRRRITHLALTNDGSILATAKQTGIDLWDVNTGQLMVRPQLELKTPPLTLAFAPDGKTFAFGYWPSDVFIHDSTSFSKVKTLATTYEEIPAPTIRLANAIFGISFSPDGRLAAAGTEDAAVLIWDIETGEQKHVLRGHQEVDFPDAEFYCQYHVNQCVFSPDGRVVVSASDDSTLKIWDVESGANLATLAGHESGVCSCAFSPNGKWIASTSIDSTVRLWNAETQSEVMILHGHGGSICGCAFSSDSSLLVSTSQNGSLKVWRVVDGACVASFYAEGGLELAIFHPGGEHIIAGGELGLYWLRLVR